MNHDKFSQFVEAYKQELPKAVENHPEDYDYRPDQAPIVAERMARAILDNPHMVNYDSPGFRMACKTLGLKHTRKAIFAFLEV